MMYYGHGSWIVVVVFAAVAVIRMVSSQRRRGGGHPGAPGPRSSFTGAGRPGAPPGPPAGQGPSPTGTGTAPGWFTDPFFKHEHRYWSGIEWTEHVSDGGAPGTDPPPPDRARRQAG